MKVALGLLLCLFPFVALAEDIKLSCDIDLTINDSSGAQERNKIKETFLISDYGRVKFIIPGSARLSTVTTKKDQGIISVSDLSSTTQWNIELERKDSQTTISTTYTIDRNTGAFWYQNKFKNETGYILTKGTGSCEKVDMAKKKF